MQTSLMNFNASSWELKVFHLSGLITSSSPAHNIKSSTSVRLKGLRVILDGSTTPIPMNFVRMRQGYELERQRERETRAKGSKFADQNQPINIVNSSKGSNTTTGTGSSKLRSASSWGSHIVKGLSGERKTRLQPTAPSKKVHPHGHGLPRADGNSKKSSGSHDLFQEIENLRGLLKESKQRELKLQAELLESKRSQAKSVELTRDVEEQKLEIAELGRKIDLLETENKSLNDDLLSLRSVSRVKEVQQKLPNDPKSLEMEVVELRRLNKELQLQKRDLACKIASMKSDLGTKAKATESDVLAKIKAEASLLRHTNEDLSKQVEGLQLSRLNEVEELAYLRWVNACLRKELSHISSKNNETSGLESVENGFATCLTHLPCGQQALTCSSEDRPNATKKMKRCSVISENDNSDSTCPSRYLGSCKEEECQEGHSSGRIYLSGSETSDGELGLSKRRQSDSFMCLKDMVREETTNQLDPPNCENQSASKIQYNDILNETCSGRLSAHKDVKKRALRTPNPPPKPSYLKCHGNKEGGLIMQALVSQPPPPPPPPPPPLNSRLSGGSIMSSVQRAPQVVEFYHSLMKRDIKKDSAGGSVRDASDVANVKSNMIDEIETRSSHLLAIKEDVETQGDFVRSLIREVNNARYRDIEDVVAFVKWLDDELSFLVDERAVLKHFDWPERKADTLREAAFGYQDLKKLESEVTGYVDDPRSPCDVALKKMVFLSEKMERTIYNLLRSRESLMHNCKQYSIPTDWMLDSGIISKVKLGAVKLAKRYMNRIALELQSKGLSLEKDPAVDYMLLQGVRFAFRIHQFAGGFDAETMKAFEELRNLTQMLTKDC